MKKLFLLAGLGILFSFTIITDPLTKKERKEAISYQKETQKALIAELKGLSDNQLNWKPADSVWSIAECVEHITLSEKNIFDMAMGTLKGNADPAKRSQLKFDDEAVKKFITDRSFRVKTREGFIPTGQFGNTEKTLAVFNERREALIRYTNDTKDDLRNHFAEFPFGLLDTYQVLLFLSGHTRRHTLQIVELKSLPGFPKV
ncbi:MAG: DinB family protein [Chitinophagales bacterium]